MSSSANTCDENTINDLKINIIRIISERKMTKEELEEFKRNLEKNQIKINGGKKKTKKAPKKKSVKKSPKKKSVRKVKRSLRK